MLGVELVQHRNRNIAAHTPRYYTGSGAIGLAVIVARAQWHGNQCLYDRNSLPN